ncbi:Serine/threonine-protein phosphatase 7 long form-like [Vitis vinifera]|uniref:Serine/threonine-protein phosphatase 7 long form-like n=1 Tax=Vitis vinifera TaxID=29760 RepID=A0A438DST6_VITVI|nr:Serine/threonine-protein phosphatase 7 long form-like [Vitis vinifera]
MIVFGRYIIQSRFYAFHRVGHIKVDWPLIIALLWSWEQLHVGRPSRSLSHALVPIDEIFLPDALGSRWRVSLSHIDTPHHVLVIYRDEFDRQQSDQILTFTPSIDAVDLNLIGGCIMSATWHYGRLEGDHIVTMEPIEPHMDYHALYMAWYCRITRRFITSMDDFGLMGYQATSICPLIGGHAFEDSNSDACRTVFVDIICMATNVMCIIWEDYRIPHVEHGGGRSPAQSTVAQLPLVRGRSTSRGRSRY